MLALTKSEKHRLRLNAAIGAAARTIWPEAFDG